MTSHRTNPAARAGHSVIRVPRALAYMRGYETSESVLNDVSLRVYLAMVDLADNSTRLLRTSVDRVAHRAGVSARSVRRTLASGVLVDLGLLTEVEDGYVHLRAPGDLTQGGFLSVPRPALWASPDASMEIPSYAVQALLLLIATSDWGGDASTSLRCDRYIETVAGGGSVDRLKRGLRYLDALPWVRVEQRGYVANLQRDCPPRRLASARTLNWAALEAYQPRAEVAVEDVLETPVKRSIEPEVATPTPRAAVLVQRRTEAPGVPVDEVIAAAQLTEQYKADRSDARRRLREQIAPLLAAGWRGEDVVAYVSNQRARQRAVINSPFGWMKSVGLPQRDTEIGFTAPLSLAEEHPGARTLTQAVLRDARDKMAPLVYEGEAPY